jgi:hypothetical protein
MSEEKPNVNAVCEQQIAVWLPMDLVKVLKVSAAANDTTMKAIIEQALRRELDAEAKMLIWSADTVRREP